MFFSDTPSYYCKLYKVKGKNPETGRMKTVEVVAGSNEKEIDFAPRSGMLPPYTITSGEEKPTEAQLAVAKKWKVKIPKSANMDDVSLLLDRNNPYESWEDVETDEDGYRKIYKGVYKGKQREIYNQGIGKKPASKKVFQFAVKNNVYLSKYSLMREARKELLYALPDMKEEIIKLTQ